MHLLYMRWCRGEGEAVVFESTEEISIEFDKDACSVLEDPPAYRMLEVDDPLVGMVVRRGRDWEWGDQDLGVDQVILCIFV